MKLFMILFASLGLAWGQTPQPLKLERTIELPNVQGRIDHMSVDVKGERLFVSALGNNTLEVIDLKAGKPVRTIGQLKEPQGVLYIPEANRIFVANRGDGSVRIFDASSFAPIKTLEYGDDADNLRYDADLKRVYVGYGSGALGEISDDGSKVSETKLDAHPESFQLEKSSPRIYVNLPDSRKIAVVDREKRTIIATWKTDLDLPTIRWPLMKTSTGYSS